MKVLISMLSDFRAVGVIMVMVACSNSPDPMSSRLDAIGQALPQVIGSWRADSSVSAYSPETLFEYINGHAEVYLAYGLRGSIAQRYVGPREGDDIVVDIFELATPADAFGVFTHDQDGEPIDIGQGGLFRYGWLSFWKGPFFVSIYAEGESDQAEEAVLALGRTIAAGIVEEGARPMIVQALPSSGLVAGSVRYLHHPNILATHLQSISGNLFHLGPGAVAALGRYQFDDETASLVLVSYRDSAMADVATEAFSERFLGGGVVPSENADGWYAMSRRSGETEIVGFILKAGSKGTAETVLGSAVAREKGDSK